VCVIAHATSRRRDAPAAIALAIQRRGQRGPAARTGDDAVEATTNAGQPTPISWAMRITSGWRAPTAGSERAEQQQRRSATPPRQQQPPGARSGGGRRQWWAMRDVSRPRHRAAGASRGTTLPMDPRSFVTLVVTDLAARGLLRRAAGQRRSTPTVVMIRPPEADPVVGRAAARAGIGAVTRGGTLPFTLARSVATAAADRRGAGGG
jgi:hypothetical protein